MADERRYSEDEVAEILERATSADVSPARGRPGSADGLTLTELQDIGAEVGIPAERIPHLLDEPAGSAGESHS